MMNTIRAREELGPNITRYIIEAPVIAAHRRPGQFVIIRLTDEGERIPLTIADVDVAAGTVSLIVQSVGKTTRQMALLKAGDAIHDIVGPLGKPNAHSARWHCFVHRRGHWNSPALPYCKRHEGSRKSCHNNSWGQNARPSHLGG